MFDRFVSTLHCDLYAVFPQIHAVKTLYWTEQNRPDRIYYNIAHSCRFVWVFKMRKKTFEMSVLRDITHLRSCHHTILTHVRTKPTKKPDSVWFIEWNENWSTFISPAMYSVLFLGWWPITIDRLIIKTDERLQQFRVWFQLFRFFKLFFPILLKKKVSWKIHCMKNSSLKMK